MKNLSIISFLFLILTGLQCSEPIVKAPKLMELVIQELSGEFDNFQQAWQENTAEDLHKVETKHQHLHLHSTFRPVKLTDSDDPALEVTHYKDRDSTKVVSRELWYFWKDAKKDLINSGSVPIEQQASYSLEALGEVRNKLKWQQKDGVLIGWDEAGNQPYRISGDTLSCLSPSGTFAHKDGEAYRMMRCRIFNGWIQYPLPEHPDSTFHMGNLRIHDQGGLARLILADGTRTDYCVELTQLVYGKRISIMKLAVYNEPYEGINYNSRSISYTWADPRASRIGINLRKLVSGWTLVEPGYLNANSMKKEE